MASPSTRLLRSHSLGSEERFSWSVYVEGAGAASHREIKATMAARDKADLMLNL
jgi:hypothetical protein